MSIKLMSAIFETEMHDLPYIKDGEERKAKASTTKLLLLALADHANDYGESSYPGYTRLEKKTCLSRQGISDTLEALKYNGLVTVSESPSKLGTNDYTINIRSFPAMRDEAAELPEVVKPLDQGSQATLLGVVKPLDHNHQVTISKTPLGAKAPMPLDWQIGHGVEKLELPTEDTEWQAHADIAVMNVCRYGADLEPMAHAFIATRRILPGKRDCKGWAQAFREMKAGGATPAMVQKAIEQLVHKNMTVADPWSIKKTVIALAASPAVYTGERKAHAL